MPKPYPNTKSSKTLFVRDCILKVKVGKVNLLSKAEWPERFLTNQRIIKTSVVINEPPVLILISPTIKLYYTHVFEFILCVINKLI